MPEDVNIIVRLKGAREASREAKALGASVGSVGKGAHAAAAPLAHASSAAGAFSHSVGVAHLAHTSFSSSLSTFAKAGTAAAVVGGLLALGKGFTFAFKQAQESELINRATANAIKATGGAANLTTDQIGGLATQLSLKTGIDDEAIQSGENLLLTFRNVRNEVGEGNDIFSQATETALDMSAAYGISLRTANIQLGKALQDPVRGAAALKKTGAIDAKAIETIKDMAKAHKSLGEQQKFVLSAINKSGAKGAAAAISTPMQRLKNSFENLAEVIGRVFMPIVTKVVGGLANFVTGLQQGKIWAVLLGGAIGAIGTALFVMKLIKIAKVLKLVTLAQKAWTVAVWLSQIAMKASVLITKAWSAAILMWRGITIAATAVMNGVMLATRAWVAVQWLLNAALTANPVGAIIVAIFALGAAIVIAWKKSETFRNIVKGALSAVKGAFIGLYKGARSAVNWIIGAFNNVVKFFSKLPDRIGGFFVGIWDGLVSGFEAAINFIIKGIDILIRGWNKLDVIGVAHIDEIGPISLTGGPKAGSGGIPGAPGIGHIGDPRMGLAGGGIISRAGLSLVGERGPELLSLPRAARVDPLPRTGPMSPLGNGVLENRIAVFLDGRQVAESVGRAALAKASRA